MQRTDRNSIRPLLAAAGLCVAAALPGMAESSVTTTDDSTPAHRCGPHAGKADGTRPLEQAIERLANELALTAQQQADIRIIAADYAQRLNDLVKLNSDMAHELLALSPDDPAYRDKTDEASAFAASSAAETVVLLAEMRGKLHAVLTPAQRKEFHDRLEQFRRDCAPQLPGGGAHYRSPAEFIG